VIKGNGAAVDPGLRQDTPEVVLSATRGGAPLLRTQGQARFELHGVWSEIGDDGRVHVELSRSGAVRVEGFAALSSGQFRLRREVAVVPNHVFLEKEAIVHVADATGDEANVSYTVSYEAMKSLVAHVRCADLGYEPVEKKYDERDGGTTGHVSTLRLFDAPKGTARFDTGVGLIFVREGERKDGFVHIEGHRHRVRFAGWSPVDLVEHEAQGSGYGAGGQGSSSGATQGRGTKTKRPTDLLVRAGTADPVKVGDLPAGARVTVRAEGSALVEATLPDVVAVDGATLLVRASDLD
jgi:hypothetical protein